MRDEIEQFKKAGIQPFGVNPASVDAHRKYVEKMKFNFPLLSDPDRGIAQAYHAVPVRAPDPVCRAIRRRPESW